MGHPDEARRRRLTGESFQDGNIVVTVFPANPEEPSMTHKIHLEHFVQTSEGRRELKQSVAMPLEDFEELVHRAVDVANDRQRHPLNPSGKSYRVDAFQVGDGYEGEVLETSPTHEGRRNYLHIKRDEEEGQPKRSLFVADVYHLARISKNAGAIGRAFEQELAKEKPEPVIYTGALAQDERPVENQFLHVVEYVRFEAGDCLVRVEQAFPGTKRDYARFIADKSKTLELLPYLLPEKHESGTQLVIEAPDFERMKKELPKLHRKATYDVSRREVEGEKYLLAVWNDVRLDPKTNEPQKPLVGTKVKWDLGEDYRREFAEYRAMHNEARNPRGPGENPFYVLINRETQCIEGVFETRKEALREFRAAESRPLSPSERKELEQRQQMERDRSPRHEIELAKQSVKLPRPKM